MLEKKKKLSKKELKEDQLVTSYYKALEFLQEYKQQHLIALGVVVIVVVGVFLYITNKQENNILATTELSRVVPIFEQGKFQESIDGQDGTNVLGFKKIADNYGGTEQGEIAKIYLANAYFSLSDFDLALKAYQDYSGSNELFKATSYAGAAACYEAKKDYSNAASNFEKASSVSKFNASNSQYLLSAGINYTEAGDKEKAKKMFNMVKDDYAASNEAKDVERHIAKLNI